MSRLLPGHQKYLLQSCIRSKALRPGKQVHAQIVGVGIHADSGPLYSKLLGLYASCGDKESSSLVFRTVEKPSTFAWNWMIMACAFRGDFVHALHYFFHMLSCTGAYLNKFTFSHALKACIGLLGIDKGKELHCIVATTGFASDVLVANALIDMYCKCGGLDLARQVFDRMASRDVVSWTAMICGHLKSGNLEQSSVLFERMKCQGLEPNDFTWNAMISRYAQNGDCETAHRLFTEMKSKGLEPDSVTWNAMIAGLGQNGRNYEALGLFSEMVASGVRPNVVTVAGLLPVCRKIGSLKRGKQVHGLIYRMGLEGNVFTVTGLIDMYSKCGSISHARRVFDQATIKNVAAYNAMIDCYSKHGSADASIQLFERMKREGLEVNQITMTCILSACSLGGLVEKGLEIFRSMTTVHKLEPMREQFACLIDLLSRSGNLEEAYRLMSKMPIAMTSNSVVRAFLNGCRIHGRSDMTNLMEDDILKRKSMCSAKPVLLSNIYAEGERWKAVEDLRKVMLEQGVCKGPGISRVKEMDGFAGIGLVEQNMKKTASQIL